MTKGLNEDLGKLLLRIPIGGLMIFHGIAKLVHGHDFIKGMLEKNGLPQFIWLGTPIGEIIAPLLILLGVCTHISSALIAFTMIISIYLTSKMNAFTINPDHGGLIGELNLFYLFAALALFFLGSGKYSLYRGKNKFLL